jgi:hypothetical protein
MGQIPGSDSALQGFEENNETDKLFIRDIVAFILFLNGRRPMPKRECERSTRYNHERRTPRCCYCIVD